MEFHISVRPDKEDILSSALLERISIPGKSATKEAMNKNKIGINGNIIK